MHALHSKTVAIATAFLLGFGMGGVCLHYAQAEGLFGLSDSVKQLGTTLTDMKKNMDALQQNMATLTNVKEQLNSLASASGNPLLKQEGETLQKLIPGFGQQPK